MWLLLGCAVCGRVGLNVFGFGIVMFVVCCFGILVISVCFDFGVWVGLACGVW